ncbi:aspartate--tRNA(Asn) ligase [Candidatus Woesearchaeota archaeon]|nr:aspartate--tRNA(Asn) ligase [Candidatus Woesearchaeota archaeon]
MLRTHTCGELRGKDADKKVILAGWVETHRIQGKLSFILLKDSSGIVQIFVNPEITKQLGEIARESIVQVEGIVKKRPDNQVKKGMETGEIEVSATKAVLINKAEPLPIDISFDTTTNFDKRLDYRFVDFHRPRIQAVFKIQNEIAKSFREYFYNQGFIEMQSPCVISAASEGGTELFPVQYFEKKAYLAQSPQLYKQMLACSFEKTVTITPVWRAEKHNTPRHINEIRQMDIEAAFYDQMSVMKELENVVNRIVKNVLANCKKELELLGIKDLKVPGGVYISYEDTVKKIKGTMGEDLTPEQEKKLCSMYPDAVVFVHSWPTKIKPFYIMPKDEDPKAEYSEGFDALYGGTEISSGGQRIHLPELLIERLKVKGLNPNDFKSYIDSFRFGAPPHSGWSIGLERITQVICKLDNVKEATMFPRDRDRLMP